MVPLPPRETIPIRRQYKMILNFGHIAAVRDLTEPRVTGESGNHVICSQLLCA